jgi:hypothetical protein
LVDTRLVIYRLLLPDCLDDILCDPILLRTVLENRLTAQTFDGL